MATSGSFSTGYVGNFYFTYEWYRAGYNSSLNEHYIHYTVYAHNTPGNYRTVYLKNLWVNGSQKFYEEGGTRYYDGDVVAQGDITVGSYNSAGDGSFNASFEAGVGITPGSNCSGEGSWDLDRIPRYANFTEHYVSSTGLNSVSVHWNADSNCDWVQYSLNGGGWTDTGGSTYTISGLSPNTQYNIRTRIRRADSQLWTESGYVYGTTKDIARITYVPNIDHGNSLSVNYSNPSGANIEIGIWKTDGWTELTGGYRWCTGSSYTFYFTDQELDNFYRLYGSERSITLRVYIKTDSNYLDYREFTITLTGNQKTIKTKTNNSWKRAKIWIKVNGTWKRAVTWAKANGTWKRSI